MRKRVGSKRDGKATGRPQRAGRRTGGKASQMLAHLGGMPIKGKIRAFGGKAGRPTGHGRAEKRPAAALKLALWPGYGLALGKARQNQFVTVTKMVDPEAQKGGKDTK